MTIQDIQQAVASLMAQRTPDDLLTQDQAALVIGVKPQTLTNWRCTKRVALPYIKVGKRSIRYRRSDVENFIAAGRVAA
jgi:hypothetical protein